MMASSSAAGGIGNSGADASFDGTAPAGAGAFQRACSLIEACDHEERDAVIKHLHAELVERDLIPQGAGTGTAPAGAGAETTDNISTEEIIQVTLDNKAATVIQRWWRARRSTADSECGFNFVNMSTLGPSHVLSVDLAEMAIDDMFSGIINRLSQQAAFLDFFGFSDDDDDDDTAPAGAGATVIQRWWRARRGTAPAGAGAADNDSEGTDANDSEDEWWDVLNILEHDGHTIHVTATGGPEEGYSMLNERVYEHSRSWFSEWQVRAMPANMRLARRPSPYTQGMYQIRIFDTSIYNMMMVEANMLQTLTNNPAGTAPADAGAVAATKRSTCRTRTS